MACKICDEKNVGPEHSASQKHIKNQALQEYSTNKSKLTGNRKGIKVTCTVLSTFQSILDCCEGKITISAKPNEALTFYFSILNNNKKDDVLVESVQVLHKKYNFVINNKHGLDGSNQQRLAPKTSYVPNIPVHFKSADIGQYQTPIEFNFRLSSTNELITIVRDMVVFVETTKKEHNKGISPYECKEVMAKKIIHSPIVDYGRGEFLIPKNNKTIYLNSMEVDENSDERTRILAADIREVFRLGVTKGNYEKFFHHLLWYEETVIRVNIKKYNMSGVKLTPSDDLYGLLVPGLAEKRPSLMNGDILFVRPHDQFEIMYEAVIKQTNDNVALIGGFHHEFKKVYTPGQLYDVRFFTSRVPLERMHLAVHNVTTLRLESRVFPKEHNNDIYRKPQLEFYNTGVKNNSEQRMAVEHIVGGASGTAPYLVHGPPGTGKTVTIVEAILQLVERNSQNRIMVCTDSNMAADHVATMLIRYQDKFKNNQFLLRANSKYRVWETLPECLGLYSNGTSRDNFEPVSIDEFMCYNIVITTLSHAAKFGRELSRNKMKRFITHLFIDEAAQASEPASLIPVSSLLKSSGQLVLAGDPHQLGPVVISRSASQIGLGKSLMERLIDLPMYSNDNPHYIVMLRNNFRSNKEILDIPDKLFYKGQLRALAEDDPLSHVDILGEKPHSHATVFHGVLSKEQRVGKSPSYFNALECDLVQQYVTALVRNHKISLDDIGVVTPYIRQVYKIKDMLRGIGYDKIEVGTVEAYQGKEKKVIVISTVRANCNLLDYDAKFQLGFLVDDKRFNVALTRAKAKVIIIGNPLCLEKDVKWRAYMQKCRDLGTYHGFDSEGVKRNDSTNNIFSKLLSQLEQLRMPNEELKK